MIFLLILFAYPAFAQDAKLTAAGRKEAKVIIYGSMEQDIFEGVRQSFEKKTGITVDYWRASGAAGFLEDCRTLIIRQSSGRINAI